MQEQQELTENENIPSKWQSAILCARECFYPSRTDIDIYYIDIITYAILHIVDLNPIKRALARLKYISQYRSNTRTK